MSGTSAARACVAIGLAVVVVFGSETAARGEQEIAVEDRSWWVVPIAAPLLAAEELAIPGNSRDGCLLALLGEAESLARELALVCVGAEGPEVVGSGRLPDGTASLALEIVDGDPFVLLGVPGGVDRARLAPDGRIGPTAAVLRDERVHPRDLSDRPDLDGDGRADLVQSVHDGLAAWRVDQAGAYRRLGQASIAPFAFVFDGQVTLSGRLFKQAGTGSLARWGGPRTDIPRRIGVDHVPLYGDRAFDACTAWVRTEHFVNVHDWLIVEGHPPRIAAIVSRSDRVSLLDEYDLIIAPLACDPTRRGVAPELFTKTSFPAGNRAELALRDVGGDGVDDLLIVGMTGRLRPRAAVAAWPGQPGGGFARRGIEWSLRVDPHQPLVLEWERDLDGDPAPDLAVATEEGLAIVRGAPAAARKIPLAKKPGPFLAWPAAIALRGLAGYVAKPSPGVCAVFHGIRKPGSGSGGDQPEQNVLLISKPPKRGR